MLRNLLILRKNYTISSTSATGRRGFCGQFPSRSGPTDNSMTGTSSSASPNSRRTASSSKPIIGVEPRPASWVDAFAAIAKKLKGIGKDEVAAVAGDLVEVESLYAAKKLIAALGSSLVEGRQNGLGYDTSSLSALRLNTGISGLERADVILLAGTNLRWEAPLLNTRVRKAIRRGKAKVFAIGPEVDLTYKATWPGNDLGLLASLPAEAADALKNAERPALLVGETVLGAEGGFAAALKLE